MALVHNKQFENYYCRYCRELGHYCVRTAGSGKSEGAYCDVIKVDNGVTYLVEVKTSKDSIYYIRKKTRLQLQAMREVCSRIGCVPLLALRFKNRCWKEIDLSDAVPSKISA